MLYPSSRPSAPRSTQTIRTPSPRSGNRCDRRGFTRFARPFSSHSQRAGECESAPQHRARFGGGRVPCSLHFILEQLGTFAGEKEPRFAVVVDHLHLLSAVHMDDEAGRPNPTSTATYLLQVEATFVVMTPS